MRQFALAGFVLALAGCGSAKGPPLGEVAGRVTFYARPVVAEVLLQPLDNAGQPTGRPSVALSGTDGLFAARFSPEATGALIGPHRVTVTVYPFADEGEPATYEDATKPLRRASFARTVREGTNRFDFPLTF
jgi:hypothetical protein